MLKFRELKTEDEAALAVLFRDRLTEKKPRWDIDSFMNNNNCFGLVLEDGKNKKIAGFGAIVFYETPIEGLTGTIQGVVIAREYAGAGWGRKLVKRLLAIARKKKAKSIWLTSADKREAAISLYLSEGFIKKETNFFVKEIQ